MRHAVGFKAFVFVDRTGGLGFGRGFRTARHPAEGEGRTVEIFRIKYEALKKINIYDTSQSQRASSYWKEVLGH